MNTCKALVVEDDLRIREAVDEVLTAPGHEYDTATCLLEARKLLKTNGYAYVLLNCQIPARLGGTPRTQNTENFLELLAEAKGNAMPPVIILLPPEPTYAGVTHEASIRWATGVTRRGAADFIAKPFMTEGRTLDRVIKKVVAGKVEPVRILWPAPSEEAEAEPSGEDADGPRPKNPTHVAVHLQEAASAAHKCDRWTHVSNEAVDLDDFMAGFCEQRSKEIRMYRKRAILAAARHGTVKLPPLAMPHKRGHANKYFVHDLLTSWQSFLDDGVDIPLLLPKFARGT